MTETADSQAFARECEERPARRRVGAEVASRAQLRQENLLAVPAVQVVVVQPGYGVLGRCHDEALAGHDYLADHRRALRDDRRPVLGLRVGQFGGDDATSRRAQVGHRVQTVAHDLTPRPSVLVRHDDLSQAAVTVEEDDIGAERPVKHVEDQPAAVRRDERSRQGGPGKVAEQELIVRRRVAETMPPHRQPEMLLAVCDGRRVGHADVGERRTVWQPRQPTKADVRDGVAQQRARVDLDHAERADPAAAVGDAVGHQATVRRRGEPVDRGGTVGRHRVGVHDHLRRNPGIDRRAEHEHRLVLAALALEGEDVVARDGGRHGRRGPTCTWAIR